MKSIDRKLFDDELDRLFTKAEEKIPDEILPDLPYMEEIPDVHDWHMFELELWDIGEEIRQFVSEHNKKFNKHQIDRIINICLDKKGKRGRQSFVMLLGRKMYGNYAEKIVSLLNDDDVVGQVINTLYKMQAEQYVDLMTPFLNHNRTWIRNEAKRYIQKYEK